MRLTLPADPFPVIQPWTGPLSAAGPRPLYGLPEAPGCELRHESHVTYDRE
ncbi:hypothetical protein GCM10009802_50520 [Streptomyces synnematoformans]|uniref:Uncharacterized protein n=1 Tax=Streptomyces synnematoformans TaxID=415721 RepID=A0ABN2ZD31_9ACTN